MADNHTSARYRAEMAVERWKKLRSNWQYRVLQAMCADPFMPQRIALITDMLESIEELSPDGSSYSECAHDALGEYGISSIEAGDKLVELLEAMQADAQAGRA
ncbi:MAG: hypothetical protein JW941_03935 [Candidatus Coatesbacteria bacterium]|nr:hypothetical protein [Candidatus Coatesbacteria bacterium]